MSLTIHKLDSAGARFTAQLRQVLVFEANEGEVIDHVVAQILADVKARSDAAVLETARRFDRIEAESVAALELSPTVLQTALDGLEPRRRAALGAAAACVRAYHEKQKIERGMHGWKYAEVGGTVFGRKVTPLDHVGIYVPGDKAAYPSSVLMNAIPARMVGVKEIVMVVPTSGGVCNELVLAAAYIAGVDRVLTIGGTQAVSTPAHGTGTVPAVDKIVGPGNAYVATAKRRMFGTVGIGVVTGPSEIPIICDGTTDPDWVTMDLFSRVGHDELTRSTLLCPNTEFIAQVEANINRQLEDVPRRNVIAGSLSGQSALIRVCGMEEAYSIVDDITLEYLEVSAENLRQRAGRIRHAGVILFSRYTSKSFGDYCVGPNHVLSASRMVRFSSPLDVYNLIKRSSLIEVNKTSAQMLGKVAAELAYGKGPQARARSAEYRLQHPMSE